MCTRPVRNRDAAVSTSPAITTRKKLALASSASEHEGGCIYLGDGDRVLPSRACIPAAAALCALELVKHAAS